jgi:hypothetical protein
MFQTLRKHLSYSNVAATMALVFALTGGAFAATGVTSGGSSPSKATASVTVAHAAKAKKKAAPKSARGPAGPAGKNGTNGTDGTPGATGPAGPAGPTGAAGAGTQGEKGIQGEKGANGTNGTNGTNGETGFTETLPTGKTETGEIGFEHENPAEGEKEFYTVSFPIPLAATVEPHFIGTNKELAGEENESPAIKEGKCKGDPQKPGASAGNFCVFASVLGAATFKGFQDDGTLAEKATGLTGDGLFFKGKVEESSQFPGVFNPASLRATWAVTAE